MLVGAALTRYLTPETCDIHGKSRKLEDLAKGKRHRREMEREERDAEESNGSSNNEAMRMSRP